MHEQVMSPGNFFITQQKEEPIMTDHTEHISQLIEYLGDNPNRCGLEDTPHRYLKAMTDATVGYHQSLTDIVNGALFPLSTDCERNMIIVRDIQIYSLCEHHLLPFFGTCTIGYIPTDVVLGLSKLARIAEMFARRLQIQERLTHEIARSIEEVTSASGVGVLIHAEHLCMSMRGAQKPGSITSTSVLRGSFKNDVATRQEFLTLAGLPRHTR